MADTGVGPTHIRLTEIYGQLVEVKVYPYIPPDDPGPPVHRTNYYDRVGVLDDGNEYEAALRSADWHDARVYLAQLWTHLTGNP